MLSKCLYIHVSKLVKIKIKIKIKIKADFTSSIFQTVVDTLILKI